MTFQASDYKGKNFLISMTMTTYLLNSLILKMVYSSNLLDISTCYVQEQQELLQIMPL